MPAIDDIEDKRNVLMQRLRNLNHIYQDVYYHSKEWNKYTNFFEPENKDKSDQKMLNINIISF